MICDQPNKSRNTGPVFLPLFLRFLHAWFRHKSNGTENGFLRSIEFTLVLDFSEGGRVEFDGERVGGGVCLYDVFIFVVFGTVDDLGLVRRKGDAEEVVAAAHR